MNNKTFIIIYIMSITFLILLLIFKNIEPLNYILGILCGMSINIMTLLYFKDGGENGNKR